MGAYPEHEQPTLPRHAGGYSRLENPRHDDCARFLCALCISVCATALLAGILAPLIWYVGQSSMSPEYSVAITGVSGLDPATDLRQGRGVLNPVFNLTVGIASHSKLVGGCISAGTSIKVSYSHLHLPMASGRAPEMCVGPGQAAGPISAVARGHDVAVPGYLLESLAEDMRRGEAMFQVRLTGVASPEEDHGDVWRVVTCWVRIGEGNGAAMAKLCSKSYVGIDKMPEEDSGYVPHPATTAGPHP